MENSDNKVKAELLKKALKLVNKLADLDIDDADDREDIEKLIKESNILKKNRLWMLN
jgi:hypothetical protein